MECTVGDVLLLITFVARCVGEPKEVRLVVSSSHLFTAAVYVAAYVCWASVSQGTKNREALPTKV